VAVTNESVYVTSVTTPWPESASELYLPSDRRLPPTLVPTFADRGCHMVSVTSLRPYPWLSRPAVTNIRLEFTVIIT
jgi:hypothetical protein